MTSITSPPSAQSASHTSLTAALITQLSSGPAFREVAASLLQDQLLEHYPELDIDPNIAMVGTPIWDIVEDQVVARAPHYQALTDILATQAVLAVPTIYIQGEHFLTLQPITEPASHLPVRIDEIASIINVLAPVIIRGYQQQQLAFWNRSQGSSGPHWHELSNVLREHWNVDKVAGWTDDDCRMARQLFQAPDPVNRRLSDPYACRAYVIDVDQIDDAGTVHHLNEHLVSVLIGKQQEREVILVYSLLQGFKKYPSRQALGQDLPILLDTSITHKKVQWRLSEPSGNFFDYLACALIAIQIKAIGAIDFSDIHVNGASQASFSAPPSAQVASRGPGLAWFQEALPDWLNSATTSDINAYSRHLKDLAALHSLNEGRTYQDGIAPLEQYAKDRLNAQMNKDHPDAANLSLDDIELVIQSPVIWGTFAVPGQIDKSVFSLWQLALQNLIALPLGVKSLRQKGPEPLPEWLTIDYLETLITRVDIGSAYPKLIKSILLDDAQESARRQQLYAEHLRIQLPLLALQCKIRNEAGIDERGYRYVVAVMQAEAADRQVDGKAIVMRPLGFVPTRRLDATPDVVGNMFVIGPQDPSAGPCLLYRPLLDRPLTQYPSPTNLLYAIQQSTNLRESVLAWLPDDARNDYGQYIFPVGLPSPWTVVEFLADPVKLWTLSGPLKLDTNTELDDLFTHLFNANANALIELADRQSVSNAEARWATFKRAGWAIFNAALPFLGRTVGTAAWIWQIMDQLQQVVDAQAHPDQQSPWVALTDLLLNLGMAIALHSVTRNAPKRAPRPDSPGKQPLPPRSPAKPEPMVLSHLPDISTDQAPLAPTQPLHISGAINRTPLLLGVVLDRFKVTKPETLGEPIDTEGPYQHLYQSGQKYYAPVGARWFEVQVDENDTVIIQDPSRSDHTGPPLINNRQGNWFVDTRLRLRGGGPTSLIKKARELAKKRTQTLRKQLSDFESEKKNAQEQLQQSRLAMDAGPSTSAQARRQRYLHTLDSQSTDYEVALQKLKELNVHEPIPDYSQKALNYLKAQTELTNAGIRETLTRFTPKLRSVLDKIEQQVEAPQERYIEDAHQMSELNQEMLGHLEYMQTRFNELNKLAKDGVRLISITKSSLPIYTTDDLKALQVTMSRNLCLPASTSTPRAWSAIDKIVDAADIAIQCLRDTLIENDEARLDEQIDTLGSLIEQFQMLDERLQDFPTEFSERADLEQLQRLRDHLSQFRQRAVSNLGLLSADRNLLRNRPTPPATPHRAPKKFIRTRYNGLLIGEPRVSDVRSATVLVDIRSPVTQKVISTFHEKTPGIWVERLKAQPPHAQVDLQASINRGQTLLDQLPAFLARATAHANHVDRTPIGIEYLYHQHAAELEKTIGAIDSGLTDSNATESDLLSANTVNKALNNAVSDLYQQSNQHVLRTLLARAPTVSGIQWLQSHNAITIKKTISRRRLKSPRPDYLDEYTITERHTHKLLWYAHFHYSTSWTSAKAYTSARLKTVQEHRLGTASDSPAGLSPPQKVDFYRSEISQEQAEKLFFERPKSTS